MNENTDGIRQNRMHRRNLDAIDRKLLRLLAENATASYAELGTNVGLSPPAVHERVKRLRREGTIARTVVQLDPIAVGKSLLAFVHVDTVGWGRPQKLLELADFPEVEEIHSVAGDSCMLLKVRTEGTQALESLLAVLYATPGVKATRSYVVLSTYIERPVQPDLTADWPAPLEEVPAGQ